MKTNIDKHINKLKLYQSANNDAESIKSSFVIRLQEFQLIIDTLKNKKPRSAFQHELILGRRGSGKSTLLRRLEIEIKEDKHLAKKYLPINFAEEQASIYRLSDLWYETYSELCRQLEHYPELKSYAEFDNDKAYTRYLFLEISKLINQYNFFPVLLIDNFDKILSNLDDNGNLLREQLLNYDNVKIISASTRMDEYFWSYEGPFYDYFRIHRLDALSLKDINALLDHWAEVMDLPELQSYAQRNKGKIEAIRILTDGLPRTLQFFIRILIDEDLDYGFDYVKKIMDLVTPIYQERLNNLTPPQRKIIAEMAFIWEACTTKSLAEKCRMQSKLISAYLKQLISYGLVDKLETGSKNHLYRISERFFNMWYIVTQGNPSQKRKAKYLTIFLENWYDKEEIGQLAAKHLNELSKGGYSYDKAVVRSKAFSQSRYVSLDMRDKLIDKAMALAEPSQVYISLPEKSQDLIKKAEKAFDEKRYDEAEHLISELENEEDGIKFYLMGRVKSKREKIAEAENYYKLAEAKSNIKAMNNLGVLYYNQGKTKEAQKKFKLAADKGNVTAMFNLGKVFDDYGETNEAEKHYKLAIEKSYLKALDNLLILFINNNIKKEIDNEALNKFKPIKKYNTASLILLNDILNGQFENIDESINLLLSSYEEENLSPFLFHLLYLEQKHLVLNLFESDNHGPRLKEKYNLLYYATLILTGKGDKNLDLRIPEEVKSTVAEIVAEVKEKNAFYA